HPPFWGYPTTATASELRPSSNVSEASRRDKTEWQGLAAPGADGTFGANAAALPRNFREVSDLLAPHRLVLKHSAAKAAEPTLWRRGAPTRKLRRSARLEAGVGRGFLST
ncbi:unnamed protein product, partial [Effrenium voratum]